MESRADEVVGQGPQRRKSDRLRALDQKLADHTSRCGAEHPETVYVRAELARLCAWQGRPMEAISLGRENLDIVTSVFGVDGAHTLDFRSSLAHFLEIGGRFDEAASLLEQNLAAQEHLPGVDHHASIRVRANVRSLRERAEKARLRKEWKQSSDARAEEVTVTDGCGVIDVRGVGHPLDLPDGWSSHCLLRINGEVTDLDTSAYEGSIGRLVARAPNRPPRPAEMAALRELTISAESDETLRDVLRPLLRLLTPGRYELRGPEPVWPPYFQLDDAVRRLDPARAIVMRTGPEDPLWFYPYPWGLPYLVPTQDWPPTDEATVLRYRELIGNGGHPVVLALRTISRAPLSGFVIDGHHKLAAYLAEEVMPPVIWITRLDAPEMTGSEIRENFPEQAETNEHFRTLLQVLEQRSS